MDSCNHNWKYLITHTSIEGDAWIVISCDRCGVLRVIRIKYFDKTVDLINISKEEEYQFTNVKTPRKDGKILSKQEVENEIAKIAKIAKGHKEILHTL